MNEPGFLRVLLEGRKTFRRQKKSPMVKNLQYLGGICFSTSVWTSPLAGVVLAPPVPRDRHKRKRNCGSVGASSDPVIRLIGPGVSEMCLREHRRMFFRFKTYHFVGSRASTIHFVIGLLQRHQGRYIRKFGRGGREQSAVLESRPTPGEETTAAVTISDDWGTRGILKKPRTSKVSEDGLSSCRLY